MYRTQLIALVVLLLAGNGLFAQTVTVVHPTAQNYIGSQPPSFIIGDDVAMRVVPGTSSGLVMILQAGAKCYVLDTASPLLTIKGVSSLWYKIKTGGHTGWVWGGYIAHEAFRSNANPNVMFLLGFSHSVMEKHKTEEYEYQMSYIRIQVLKEGKQVQEVIHRMPASYFYSTLHGSRGVAGVTDVLEVHDPCEGGCGCSGGDTYFFWDGTKLHFGLETGGTADAEFSEGTSVVFPSDTEGEKGYIIKKGDFIGKYDYNNGRDIMQRDHTLDYYVWSGTKLEKASDKKSLKWSTYYNYETHKEVEKPDDAD